MPATTITQSASSQVGERRSEAVQAGHAGVLVDGRPWCRAARRGCAPRARPARPTSRPRRSRRARPRPAARARSRRSARARAPASRRSTRPTAAAQLGSARVTSTLPAPPSSSARTIGSTSEAVLPSASTASGAPWRSSRWVSTRANPRSRKGSDASCSSAIGDVDPAGGHLLEQLLDVAAQAQRPDARSQRHSPVKVGGRFSTNASTPSRKSCARAQQAVGEALDLEPDEQRRVVASVEHALGHAQARAASAPRARRSARRRPPASARGHDLGDEPQASASSAAIRRPRMTMSFARPRPTIRASRWRPARAGDHPERRPRAARAGRRRRDAEVAGERELEPDAEAVAESCGDHGLRSSARAPPTLTCELRERLSGALPGTPAMSPPAVNAAAGAGEHDDAHARRRAPSSPNSCASCAAGGHRHPVELARARRA